MTAFQILQAHAASDRVAVGEAGARSARELLSDVAALAARMRPGPGELLVTCQDRYHLTVALLAAWQRGKVVALPPNSREQTLAELATHCSHSLHDGSGPGADLRGWLPAKAPDSASAPPPMAAIPAEQMLVTIYTSGSTGQPVACHKTAAQLLGEAETLRRTFEIGPRDCILATVPAHHIYGLLFSVALPLLSGARFVRETPLHTSAIEEAAGEHGATALVSVPAHLQALASAPSSSLAAIARVFSSGGPLPDATAQNLARRYHVVVREVLGSTETGGYAFRCADEPGALFRPFDGVQIEVGSEQQLFLRSPLLDRALAQPLACPDRIELHPDGSFRHLGRSDSVVKVAGTRVSLADLEARVRSLPGVSDAVALAAPGGQTRGQEIWLVVATPQGRELANLRSELLRYYEPVLLPRRTRFVAALPREATGKLQRARLLALFATGKEQSTAFAIGARNAFTNDRGSEGQRCNVHVPENLVYFSGHFEGDPILPAVAQLDGLVLDEIALRWPELCELRELTGLKWRAPIRPGDDVVLELLRDPERPRVEFAILRARETCAQGSLEFAPGSGA